MNDKLALIAPEIVLFITTCVVMLTGQWPSAIIRRFTPWIAAIGLIGAAGANSGPAVVADPGTLGAGLIVSGSLEMSNVDLGEEFTQMILTSTGYSASSRVIRTADELMQQLLVLGR